MPHSVLLLKHFVIQEHGNVLYLGGADSEEFEGYLQVWVCELALCLIGLAIELEKVEEFSHSVAVGSSRDSGLG